MMSDGWEMKRMKVLVLAAAVNVTMSNHVYTVGDTIFLQREGGPSGLQNYLKYAR